MAVETDALGIVDGCAQHLRVTQENSWPSPRGVRYLICPIVDQIIAVYWDRPTLTPDISAPHTTSCSCFNCHYYTLNPLILSPEFHRQFIKNPEQLP